MVYGSRFIEIKEYVLSLESLYVFVANKPFMYKRNSSAYLSQKNHYGMHAVNNMFILAVFSSRKSLGFGTVAYFVII